MFETTTGAEAAADGELGGGSEAADPVAVLEVASASETSSVGDFLLFFEGSIIIARAPQL